MDHRYTLLKVRARLLQRRLMNRYADSRFFVCRLSDDSDDSSSGVNAQGSSVPRRCRGRRRHPPPGRDGDGGVSVRDVDGTRDLPQSPPEGVGADVDAVDDPYGLLDTILDNADVRASLTVLVDEYSQVRFVF